MLTTLSYKLKICELSLEMEKKTPDQILVNSMRWILIGKPWKITLNNFLYEMLQLISINGAQIQYTILYWVYKYLRSGNKSAMVAYQ